MAQVLTLKAKGLYTSPNEFSSVPDGAMVRANNVVIDVDGIVEPRRGNNRIRQFPSGSDRGSRYAIYQDTLIANWTGGYVGYDNGSSWTAYSGTYQHSSSTLARLRFLNANNNLYFTTSAGTYKLDAYNGTPVLAGMFKGLDLELSLSGSSGFLSTANQAAYRILWGIRDAQNNIITGAPSGRAVVINSTGGSRDVALTTTIPSGITTSHFFQVYRSKASGGVAVEPDDELGLVYENNPTAGEITAGVITFTDRTTDDLRGQTIYTAPSQDGILQSNERPPQADDFELFQNCVVYCNTKSKYRKTFTILACGGTSGIAFNDTITIAGVVYTAKGTEASATGYYSLAATTTTTGDVANGSPTITNVASSAGLKVGRTIAGTGIPASTFIGAFTATTISMVDAAGVAVNGTATNAGVTLTTTTGGTPAQNIFDTAQSLVRVINRYASNTLVYAYYLSAPGDLPGQILIEERGLGGSVFYLLASAHSTAFNPVLPTSGTTVAASNDDLQDQIMISRSGKGEAVPLANTRRVGSANYPSRRVKKLRNSCFIFKEKDGIYRMTGNTPEDFAVELFDSSANLIAPDTVAVVNNEIWCLTDQGVAVVTETGVSVVSRPIEDLILDTYGTALDQVRYYSHAVGYETDRKYILFTVSTSGDTVATQAFVFNCFTRAFTRWPISKAAGLVSVFDDRMYLADGASSWTEKERKTRDYTDYVDYGTDHTISSYSTTTIYLTSTNEVEVGDLLYQSSSVQSLITDVQPAYVTVADSITWTVGTVTVYKGISCEVEYSAITGGNPGMTKQFPEVSFLFKAARFTSATAGFATDVSGYFEDVTLTGNRTGLWGLFPWGTVAWGGTATTLPIRAYIPLEKQRGSLLRIRFSHRQGYGYFKLLGISVPVIGTGSFVVAK